MKLKDILWFGATIAVAVLIPPLAGVIAGAKTGFAYYAWMTALYVGTALAARQFAPDPEVTNMQYGNRTLLQNKTGTSNSIPVVYGERRIAGNIVFANTLPNDRSTICLVIVLCEGPVENLGSVYFNDVIADPYEITDLAEREKYIKLHGNRFKDHYTITKFKGDQTTASAKLLQLFPANCSTPWSEDMILVGVAYLVVTLRIWVDDKGTEKQKMNDPFMSIPHVTCDVKGRKVLDPRTNLTAWSSNPALCLRDYLTNQAYGIGLSSSLIDDTSFSSAASYCDTLITAPDGKVEPRYWIASVLEPFSGIMDNVKKFLPSMGAALVWTRGYYVLLCDRPAVSTFDISESILIGEVDVALGSSSAIFNRVKIQWYNPKQNWDIETTILDEATLRSTEDGDILLDTDVNYSQVTSGYVATRLGQLLLNKSRRGLRCKVTITHAGFFLVPFQIVTLFYPLFGWEAGKKFQILSLTLQPEYKVDLELLEYDEDVYAVNSYGVFGRELYSSFENLGIVDPPTNLRLSSGTEISYCQPDGSIINRVLLEWDRSTSPAVLRYEIKYKLATLPDWEYSFLVDGELSEAFAVPVVPKSYYDFQVRAEGRSGQKSEILLIKNYYVKPYEGPIHPPHSFRIAVGPNNSRIFSWEKSPLITCGFAGFRLFFSYGTSTTLTGMMELVSDFVTSPLTFEGLSSGTYTFALVSETLDGRRSDPLFITAYLSDPLLGAVYEVLVAGEGAWDDLADSWNALPNTWDTIVPFFKPVVLGEGTWNDLPLTWDDLPARWDHLFSTPSNDTTSTNIVDLGANQAFLPLLTPAFRGTGSVLFLMKTGLESDGTVVGAWSKIGWTSARYIQFQIQTFGVMLDSVLVRISRSTFDLHFEDVSLTTNQTGIEIITPGYLKIGTNVDIIEIVSARIDAIQNVNVSCSWELISKTETLSNGIKAASFKVRDGSGNLLTSGLIDATIRCIVKV